jgi:hypothetical protein
MNGVLAMSSRKAESTRRKIIYLFGFVGVLSIHADALAQVPDARAKIEAQKLYEDGANDMEADAYSRACPKFEAAFKILPDHIRTGVTLAECLDKWGKPASALGVLEKVLPLAKARGDKAKVAEVEASIADLDHRVPRLTIRVSSSLSKTPGLAISRATVPVPPASWGKPIPLDPGEYEIEVSAVDKPIWKTTVQLVIGEPKTVDIVPGWKESEKVEEQTRVVPPPLPVGNGLRTVGFVGIGLGAAGLATWGVLGGLAISQNNASKERCSRDHYCDEEGTSRRNDAIGLGHGATIGLIAGSAFLATGVSLVVIAAAGRKESKRAATWTVTDLLAGPSGVGVRGVW